MSDKKKKPGRNKGKKYDKPVTLHPLTTKEALEALLETKPKEKETENVLEEKDDQDE
jgi:hypothetical protein